MMCEQAVIQPALRRKQRGSVLSVPAAAAAVHPCIHATVVIQITEHIAQSQRSVVQAVSDINSFVCSGDTDVVNGVELHDDALFSQQQRTG